ncbi:MAG: response regulator, partial [Vicinamibacterales bacterium]
MRLLLVEDDPEISRFLLQGLREDGHLADLVEDGQGALDQVAAGDYDAILLDLMLPGVDGFEVCRRMREAGVDAPILVVSARDAVSDRIRGLDAGADDYIVKPFAFEEVLARLRALARRGRTRHLARVLEYGPISVDPVDHA